jgi:hypothetical protein
MNFFFITQLKYLLSIRYTQEEIMSLTESKHPLAGLAGPVYKIFMANCVRVSLVPGQVFFHSGWTTIYSIVDGKKLHA